MRSVLYDITTKTAKIVVKSTYTKNGLVHETQDGMLYGVAYNNNFGFISEEDAINMINIFIEQNVKNNK